MLDTSITSISWLDKLYVRGFFFENVFTNNKLYYNIITEKLAIVSKKTINAIRSPTNH